MKAFHEPCHSVGDEIFLSVVLLLVIGARPSTYYLGPRTSGSSLFELSRLRLLRRYIIGLATPVFEKYGLDCRTSVPNPSF